MRINRGLILNGFIICIIICVTKLMVGRSPAVVSLSLGLKGRGFDQYNAFFGYFFLLFINECEKTLMSSSSSFVPVEQKPYNFESDIFFCDSWPF